MRSARPPPVLGWELPHLLDAVEPDEVFSTVTERVVASRWASERCAVIGDAAHAVHPIAGMGATLALADARCVGQLLACSSAAPGRALAAPAHARARVLRPEHDGDVVEALDRRGPDLDGHSARQPGRDVTGLGQWAFEG